MNEYLVIRKEQVHKQCVACKGTGIIKTGKKQCSYCGGKGITTVFRTTEVPLKVALAELEYSFGTNKEKVLPASSKIDQVVKAVCNNFDITPDQLFDHRRDRELVELRYLFFRFVRSEFRFTYKDIGKKYGGFDHATVRRGRYEVEKWKNTDKVFASKFSEFNLMAAKILNDESNPEI